MGTSTDIPGLQLIHDKEVPLLISGPPDRVQCLLLIENTTADKLTLKSMPVEAADLRDEAGDPLSEAHVFGRIGAGQQGRVQIEFPIDPATPAGTYQASLHIGREIQAALVVICEQFELAVEPDTVTLHVTREAEIEREFTLMNRGNVTLALDAPLVVPLTQDGGLEYALRSALLQVGTTAGSGSADATTVLHSIAGHLVGPATLRWNTASLRPGETRLVKARLQLPDNMLPDHHYRIAVELYSSGLTFDIYTHSEPVVVKTHKPRKTT